MLTNNNMSEHEFGEAIKTALKKGLGEYRTRQLWQDFYFKTTHAPF